MHEYLITASVGDLIRKAKGTQELPKATTKGEAIHVPGVQPTAGVQASQKARDLS
ncbi:MAG: hypothetical protein HY843_04545 [Bdellovibrio sp.]|nr:hypothetical protein [Bdellovibrio sp.]